MDSLDGYLNTTEFIPISCEGIPLFSTSITVSASFNVSPTRSIDALPLCIILIKIPTENIGHTSIFKYTVNEISPPIVISPLLTRNAP